MVQSLGVQIGPPARPAKPKCPFSGMVSAPEHGGRTAAGVAWTADRAGAAAEDPRVRPPDGARRHRAVRAGKRPAEIDEQVLERARDFFGM